jgi:hypothetical protein
MSSSTPPSSVVLNVTVTNPTGYSFLTAYPADAPRPNASDLNYRPGVTVPNLVVVQLAADGTIDLYNNLGNADVVVDVEGWYNSQAPPPASPLAALASVVRGAWWVGAALLLVALVVAYVASTRGVRVRLVWRAASTTGSSRTDALRAARAEVARQGSGGRVFGCESSFVDGFVGGASGYGVCDPRSS